MSYKKLLIWQIAKEVVKDVHAMSLDLPRFEMYEEGQQIRRSVKSIRSNIVEACLPVRQGYGRRRYKQDYIRFIIYALSSNDETIDHLEILYETNSLKDKKVYEKLHKKLNILGVKINNFLSSVESGHKVPNKSPIVSTATTAS